MVSPACGNRGVTAMRSMFKLPITTIFAMDLAVVGESDQADGCDIQNRHPTQGDPRDPGSFRKFTPYEHAPRGGDQRSRLPNGVGNWNTHETRSYEIAAPTNTPGDAAECAQEVITRSSLPVACHGHSRSMDGPLHEVHIRDEAAQQRPNAEQRCNAVGRQCMAMGHRTSNKRRKPAHENSGNHAHDDSYARRGRTSI